MTFRTFRTDSVYFHTFCLKIQIPTAHRRSERPAVWRRLGFGLTPEYPATYLNMNSSYCYIPRSSKHTDTCT